ncbi:MAG TPA: FixH family protein [Solirubrobacteraceae bacterium]|jgi:hypothetical protein|nr:FixH family protein [Solirubrobacteraceae bacterium]
MLLLAPAAAAAQASLGPGAGRVVIRRGTTAITLAVTPNSSGGWNTATVTAAVRGNPVRRGHVHLSFTMLAMSMGTQRFALKEVRSGIYRYVGPGFLMSGDWRLEVEVAPRRGRPFTADVRDVVRG